MSHVTFSALNYNEKSKQFESRKVLIRTDQILGAQEITVTGGTRKKPITLDCVQVETSLQTMPTILTSDRIPTIKRRINAS